MKPGRYSFGAASCQLNEPQVLEPEYRDRVRELSHLFVKPLMRRQGHATRLMKMMCRHANASGVALLLSVSRDGSMSPVALERWYKRFGFVVIQTHPLTLMMRPVPGMKPVVQAEAVAHG